MSSSLPPVPRPKVINTDDCDYLESEHEPIETFEKNSCSGDVSSDEINDIIYAFVIRHDLTKAATQDLLTLIRMINPDLVGVASSMYALRKRLQTRKWNSEAHYLCSCCKMYIGTLVLY
ncbi:unnamed protein product [Allacma fusca]|uniref:Uncharacterized protein n=1 Tax=Allacma fusca TaxID=39272 RepID=A0A8J2NH51_9HEXA|nr:unnamed protein product [Allacma fusca]